MVKKNTQSSQNKSLFFSESLIGFKHSTETEKFLLNYKNASLLRNYINMEGKILPRRFTGLSARQQRLIAKAIKNARLVGLLSFVRHPFS